MKLSVIIPAFNEANRLPATLNRIFEYLSMSGLNRETEVLVVDDGSFDKTAQIVLARPENNLRLISHDRNLGKGAAVKTGALKASGENVLFLDADYSTALDELAKFQPKLEQGYDLIIGSRAIAGSRVLVRQNPLKVWLGKAGNLAVRLLLGLKIHDSQCGFKLFNRQAVELFKQQTVKGWGFDFEILYLAKKRGLQILELPVSWTNNRESRVRPIDYLKTLRDLIIIKVNDLQGKYEEK